MRKFSRRSIVFWFIVISVLGVILILYGLYRMDFFSSEGFYSYISALDGMPYLGGGVMLLSVTFTVGIILLVISKRGE